MNRTSHLLCITTCALLGSSATLNAGEVSAAAKFCEMMSFLFAAQAQPSPIVEAGQHSKSSPTAEKINPQQSPAERWIKKVENRKNLIAKQAFGALRGKGLHRSNSCSIF